AHESIYTFGSVLFPPSLTLNSANTRKQMIKATMAFTFLAFWFARLANSLQFTVFSIGYSRAGRIILYFQYILCALGITVTGIAIPSLFGNIARDYSDSLGYG